MLDNFYNFLDNVISEAAVDNDSPALEKTIKNFLWKNSRYLRLVKDEERKEKAIKETLQFLIDEFKEKIGSVFSWFNPAGGRFTGKVIDVDEENFLVKFSDAHSPFETKSWQIGLLMTDKGLQHFLSLIDEDLKKYNEQREEAAAKAKAQKEEKKASYSTPEIQELIKKFESVFISTCSQGNGHIKDEDFKQEFKELTDKEKQALINYFEDYVFTNPHLSYYDGPDYYTEKNRLQSCNSRKNNFVEELKQI